MKKSSLMEMNMDLGKLNQPINIIHLLMKQLINSLKI